jgi:ABC-type transport system involved in multi-copper enzyme maturation permease subunit
LGPLFYYELVRLARRGRSTVIRCVYILVIFVALYFLYRGEFPAYDPLSDPFAAAATDVRRQGVLARDFVMAVLCIQAVGTLLLAPSYLGVTVAGERERGTLDLLFTTHLRDSEIVVGKLASHVAHLGGVLLAGLPLLAATQLWGGVDFLALLCAFAAAGFNLLSIASLSIWCSVVVRRSGEALFVSYMLSAELLLGLAALFLWLRYSLHYPVTLTAPGVFLDMQEGPAALGSSALARLQPLATCVAVNGAIAGITVLSAIRNVRRRDSRVLQGKPAVVARPRLSKRSKFPAGRPIPRMRLPLGNRPLLWKEMGPVANPGVFEFLNRSWPVLVLSAAGLGWLVRTYCSAASREMNDIFMLSAVMMTYPGLAWCGFVAMRAAISVCRERERNTLDSLLTLPQSRSAILGAKWLGALLYPPLDYFVAMALAFNLGLNITQPLPGLLLTIAVAAQVAFLASLGICVSVRLRSTLRAGVAMALLLFFVFGSGWVALGMDSTAGRYVDGFGALSTVRPDIPLTDAPMIRGLFYTVGLNPMGSWWCLGGPRRTFDSEIVDRQWLWEQCAVSACGTVLFALTAGALWMDARRCFLAERTG